MHFTNLSIFFSLLRPNVSYESIFRWRIPELRLQSDRPHAGGSRGSRRSHDLHLSADDQMYILQVRRERRSGAPRRHLYIASERGEREDLYISMVLVHHPYGAHDHNINLPHRYYIFAADASLLTTTEI